MSYITQLTLTNFRNYPQLSVLLSCHPVVLTGANGAGKTNLLEAVSLFAPGRGLRRAKLSEIDSTQAKIALPWAVRAVITSQVGGTVEIGTGRDAAASGAERRIVRIESSSTGQNALTDHVRILWLTPQMDGVFSEGGTARRKFFDRLVYGFEADHASHVAAYEQAMRERNQLLQDRRNDNAWFLALEHKMAEHAVVVASYRLQTMARLNEVISQSQRDFPKARLFVSGVVEDLLQQDLPSLEVEEKFRALLAANRREDLVTGRTGQGIHRSEWRVIHSLKDREAAYCSTGEQKALLLSILLAEVRAIMLWENKMPILLLDEVVAHLDVRRRKELAEEIVNLGVQTWLTGTDAETFADFSKNAQFLSVKEGKIIYGCSN